MVGSNVEVHKGREKTRERSKKREREIEECYQYRILKERILKRLKKNNIGRELDCVCRVF